MYKPNLKLTERAPLTGIDAASKLILCVGSRESLFRKPRKWNVSRKNTSTLTKADRKLMIRSTIRTFRLTESGNRAKLSADPRSTVFFKSANPLDLSPKSTIRELFKAKSADPRTYSPPSKNYLRTLLSPTRAEKLISM